MGGVAQLPVLHNGRTTIVERTTSEFRRDLQRLSPSDRARVLSMLRRSYELLRDNRRRFFANVDRPIAIHLKSGLSSSLYSLRVGRDIRLIMAVDDDPVFAQILVTLFRVVRHNELARSYRSVAELLYRNPIERNSGALQVPRVTALFDGWGVIYEAAKRLPAEYLKLGLLEALAELEDHECHRTRKFPKTRLHRVVGYQEPVYRADIDKISGWRLHLQYEDGQVHLKDIIEGQRHDDVLTEIEAKKVRYTKKKT